MAQHLESNFAIRNLLASSNGTNPALTPPPSDGSLSPNNSLSSNEENHGNRPNLTYGALVTMAIRSSPEGKLTLNAIQSWISANYPYYRKEDQGWQNQTRQTLSTNSCFFKIPRALDDPGLGNYWGISPDSAAVGFVSMGNGTAHEALINGVQHPQVPNAVYFLTKQEVQGAHQTQLVQALHEHQTRYQYHLQQTQILQQQLFILQHQQVQQPYQNVYQKLMFHQQQLELLTSQQTTS